MSDCVLVRESGVDHKWRQTIDRSMRTELTPASSSQRPETTTYPDRQPHCVRVGASPSWWYKLAGGIIPDADKLGC